MKRTVAAIFAISILGAAMFLAHAYKTRGDRAGNISVTGLGSIDFESDVISWSGIYETTDEDLADGFETIRKHRKIVEEYLLDRGVKPEKSPSVKSIPTKKSVAFTTRTVNTPEVNSRRTDCLKWYR